MNRWGLFYVCGALPFFYLALICAAENTIEAGLRSENAIKRSNAIAALRDNGIEDEATRSAVAAALERWHDDRKAVEVKISLLEALSARPGECESLLPQLIAALGDRNEFVRWHTCKALAAMGPAAERAVPALIEALNDRRADLAVGSFVDGSKWSIARLAVYALGRIRAQPEATAQALVRTLENPDARVRQTVVQTLPLFSSHTALFLPMLIEQIKHRKDWARESAVEAIAALGPLAVGVLPDLLQVLQDLKEDSEVRHGIVLAIEQMGPLAAPAIPLLLGLIEEGNHRFMRAAESALRKIGPKKDTVISGLQPLLNHPNTRVRLSALQVLADAGSAGKSLQVEAERLTQDREAQIRAQAYRALAALRYNDLGSNRALMRGLEDKDASVRRTVVELYGNAMLLSIELQEELLRKAMKDSDWAVRSAALLAGSSKGSSPHLVPFYTEALTDRNLEVRKAAADALFRMGPLGKSAVNELAKVAESSRYGIQAEAIEALGAIGSEAVQALPVLQRIAASSSPWLKQKAQYAIIRISKPREPALSHQ